LLATLALLAVPAGAFAQQSVDYLKEIKPLLREKCFTCHGALKQKARLRLDTAALAKKGGRSGPAVRPGEPARSPLLARVTALDAAERMPPESPPLAPAQVARLRAWIAQGAPAPANEKAEDDPRDHWAFRVPQRPPVPKVKDPAWSRNPIDAFLAAEHEKQRLVPRPPQARSLLLRRVYLDLIGLPPTRAELHAFLADSSPEAYEKVVDLLLADPRYGERWGRHWMDVWRYSDWYGRRMVPDVWNSAPQIWRWRDWVVKSLNADKGYDRMVQEMLAADEICPEDADATVATGFLIRNWYALNPNDWMRSNVEHTGKAFLGLTFNCAHCHDHKYDPIRQDDYFRLRAFFEPIGIRQDRVPGEADPGPFQEYSYSALRKVVRLGTVRIFDKNPQAPTWFYTGGDERNRVKTRGSILPGVPEFFGESPQVKPISLPPAAYYPALRPAMLATLLREKQEAITKAERELVVLPKTTAGPLLRNKLSEAEAELTAILARSASAGQPAALSGKQSLIFDATAGRRIVQNNLIGLKTFKEGMVLRFELLLLKDAHFNFQLARDLAKGLTAGYVGFDKGRILSYRPGTVNEFEAGRYDFAVGQKRFEVALTLQSKADRCLLTVRSRPEGKLLVDRMPVALNGWRPLGDPTKGILFDARTGSQAAIDDLVFLSPAGVRLLGFDFEAPTYTLGNDVAGIEGWSAHALSIAPATSLVAMTAPSPALQAAVAKVRRTRRAVDAAELPRKAAEARVGAARAELANFQARITAERAKFAPAPGRSAAQLAAQAVAAERNAAVKTATAAVLTSEQKLAAVEIGSTGDPTRSKVIAAAAQQRAAAQVQLAHARAALQAPSGTYTPLGPTYPTTSTGRRKAFAEWITSPANPLTARVAVNHIWTRHFQTPLVASVFDFGRNGARPTHPELLDWLAVELMQPSEASAAGKQLAHPWSMKHIHRLIVTSRAYRMSSSQGSAQENVRRDPENKFLWRMNIARMEAEVVRDSLFYLAGLLDPTIGGQELENSQALTTHRRSLYYSCHPETDGKNEFGILFDAPEPGECYRRTRTIVPQQALALTNSDLVHEVSGKLRQVIWKGLSATERNQRQSFVTAAYERVLSRRPTAAELTICVDFLSKQTELNGKAADAAPRARESLLRVLLNHNDFVTIR
jgi:hypothetical protein